MTEPILFPPGGIEPPGGMVATRTKALRGRITPVQRATAGSVLTGLVGQLNLLVSGVLAARMLGPEHRGHLALLVLIPMALSYVGSLGIPLAATYFIARSPGGTRPIVFSILRLAALQVAVLLPLHTGLLLLLYGNASDDVQEAAMLSVAVVPASIMLHLGVAILQGRRQFTAVNVCRLLPSLLWVLAVVSMFGTGREELALLTLLWGAAYVVAGAIALATALWRMPATDPLAEVPGPRRMTRFGTRAFIGAASPVEMFSADQAIVGLFVSPAALGLYVVATAFTNLPRFLAQSVGLVAYPSIAALPDRASMKASLWRFFLVTLALSAACVAVLELLVGTLIPLFYGTEFIDAVPLTRLLLVAAVFISCRRVLADGARGCGRPVLSSVAEAASWVSLLVLLPVLVPLFGVNGVAIAVVLSSATSFLVLAMGLWAEPAKSASGQERGERRRRPPVALGMSWIGGLAWLVAAFGAGAILPFLSSLAASVLITTLAVAGLAVAARRHFRRLLRSLPSGTGRESRETADVASGSSGSFRMARGFYYLGLFFIGQAVLRPASGLTLSDMFFLAAFLSACLELVVSRRGTIPALRPRSLVIGAALFGIGVLISSISLDSPGPSLNYGLRFLYITLVWFWVGSVILRNVTHVTRAVWVWVISIGLSGLAALAQLFLGDVIPGTSPIYGRMTGTALHVNDLGGMTGIALAAAIALVARPSGGLRSRQTAVVLVVLIAAGTVLSGSMGGLLAATAGTAIYAVASRIRGRTVVTTAILLVGGALLVSAQQEAGAPNPLQRASQVTGPEDDPSATLWSRVDTNQAALEAIAKRPLVGHGMGHPVPATGFQVHNVVLGPWYEGGLFALGGIVVILTGLLITGLQAVRAARSGQEWQLAIALVAAFCSFVVFAMGAPVLFQRYGWVAGALLVALRRQQMRTRRTTMLPSSVAMSSVVLKSSP